MARGVRKNFHLHICENPGAGAPKTLLPNYLNGGFMAVSRRFHQKFTSAAETDRLEVGEVLGFAVWSSTRTASYALEYVTFPQPSLLARRTVSGASRLGAGLGHGRLRAMYSSAMCMPPASGPSKRAKSTEHWSQVGPGQNFTFTLEFERERERERETSVDVRVVYRAPA